MDLSWLLKHKVDTRPSQDYNEGAGKVKKKEVRFWDCKTQAKKEMWYVRESGPWQTQMQISPSK